MTNTLASPLHCDLGTGSTLRDAYGTPPGALKHFSLHSLCWFVGISSAVGTCLSYLHLQTTGVLRSAAERRRLRTADRGRNCLYAARCNVASFKAYKLFCCYSGTRNTQSILKKKIQYCILGSNDFYVDFLSGSSGSEDRQACWDLPWSPPSSSCCAHLLTLRLPPTAADADL